MKITLKLYASLQDYLPAEARKSNALEVDVTDTTSIGELIERHKLPKNLCHLVLVDGIFIPPDARGSQIFREGQILSIWPPVAGG